MHEPARYTTRKLLFATVSSGVGKISSVDGGPNDAPQYPERAVVRPAYMLQPQHPPRSSTSRRLSVPPIRSLSVRQPVPFPSAANLRNPRTQTPASTMRPSATISRAIRRLEDLLDEAEDLVQLVAEDGVEEFGSLQESTKTRRPSAGIRSRAAPIIQSKDPLAHAELSVSPKPRGSVTFEITEGRLKDTAIRHNHAAGALRACSPAHEQESACKPPPAPVSISPVGGDFEWNKVSRRKGTISRFKEDLEPATLAPVSLSLKKPEQKLSRRRSKACNSLSGEDIEQYIEYHCEQGIQQSTSSTEKRNFARADRETYSGLPPTLKNTTPEIVVINEHGDEDSGSSVENPPPGHEGHFSQMFGLGSRQASIDLAHPPGIESHKIDLRHQRHVDVPNKPEGFDVHEFCNHAPIARDWPTSRKSFAATIACINTACLGIIIGIYAGEVPAIQYVIADFHHYTILGNVFFYCGLAIPTLLLWPLPLLHGRKPYTVISLALGLCLQIPQGIAVGAFRSPDISTYRILLLLARGVSGFVFGFANINFQGSLLDLFGASLQVDDSHRELIDAYDARRHGGGMGVWLGIWSWCSIGSISLGFFIGAFVISSTSVTWGFWTCLLLLMVVLLLNIIGPETRRSAFRRTISEIQGEGGGFNRVARGEVKMHLKGTGPYWWGEEVKAGAEMCWLMVKQPGFLIISVYAAWVYAQFTMVLMFLGALSSTYYMYRPIDVGLCVLSLALGAGIATPFQKASWLSRARSHPPRTDSMSFRVSGTWSSHPFRRTLFTIALPLAAIGYTLTLKGPPLPIAAPCIFAGLVGFASNMAIAECYGLIMEAFDTSDLQAGMTGRPARRSAVEKLKGQRTNFSCYPRVSAGFAVTQSLKFIFGAAATGLCGRLERKVGAMHATGIVAGVLMVLTLLLTIVLFRWKTVKMIPDSATVIDRVTRREPDWEPVILGRPSGTMRKISILEAGRQSRWSEIRRRNRVESGLTGSGRR